MRGGDLGDGNGDFLLQIGGRSGSRDKKRMSEIRVEVVANVRQSTEERFKCAGLTR